MRWVSLAIIFLMAEALPATAEDGSWLRYLERAHEDQRRCGPHAAYLACRYFGRSVDIEAVYSALLEENTGGVDLLAVKKYLEGHELRVVAVQASVEELTSLGKAFILVGGKKDWKLKHFVFAIYRDNDWKIADPAVTTKLESWSAKELGEWTEGVALVIAEK